jgi:hypothetical protein
MFHDKDLGGVIRYYGGCNEREHFLQNTSSLECALAEGFADYYAVATRGTATEVYLTAFQTNHYYRNFTNGTDGSIIEGAVAALLLDLTDNDNEYGDYVQGSYNSHKWLGDMVKTCRVTYPASTTDYYGNRGIDHLLYCMERRSPYSQIMSSGETLNFFTTRSSTKRATREEVFSTELWPDASSIRRTWMFDLYSKDPKVGTNPQF